MSSAILLVHYTYYTILYHTILCHDTLFYTIVYYTDSGTRPSICQSLGGSLSQWAVVAAVIYAGSRHAISNSVLTEAIAQMETAEAARLPRLGSH